MLIMVMSLMGMSLFTAAAAPGSLDSGTVTPNQTAELCNALDVNGDLTITPDEAAALDVDLNGDGVVDEIDRAIAINGCNSQTSTGAPLTADVCVNLLDAGLINAEGTVLDRGAFANAALDLGLSPAQISSALNGECAGLLPGEEPGIATLSLTVRDADGNPIRGALVTFPDLGITSSTGFDGTFTTDSVFPAGTYAFTVTADGYEPADGTLTVTEEGVASTAVTLVAIPVETPPTGEITLAVCEDLDADGNGLVDSDEVTALGIDLNDDGVINANDHAIAIAECNTLLGGEYPTGPNAEQGTVNLTVFQCGNIQDAYFETVNPAIMARAAAIDVGEPTCVPGSALFSFYLIGDGTADYTQLAVDGSGTINLDPGQYQIVEENTQASITVDVVASSYTTAAFYYPSDVPADPTENMGTVNVSVFYCDGLENALYLDPADPDAVGAVNDQEGCAPGQGLFQFTLLDDGVATFMPMALQAAGPDVFELNVVGSGSIGLGAGVYDVVELNTGATTTITVAAGTNLSLVFQTSTPQDPAPNIGTVNVAAFYCDNVDEPTFQITEPGAVTTAAVETGDPNCEPGRALFTFYFVGDGTADFAQLEVDGANSIALAAGRYEVVEENSQARTFLNVYADENTNVVFLAPAGTEPAPEQPAAPGEEDNESETGGESDVTELPSTGSGSSDVSTSGWMLMAGAAMLSAAGFGITRRQANR